MRAADRVQKEREKEGRRKKKENCLNLHTETDVHEQRMTLSLRSYNFTWELLSSLYIFSCPSWCVLQVGLCRLNIMYINVFIYVCYYYIFFWCCCTDDLPKLLRILRLCVSIYLNYIIYQKSVEKRHAKWDMIWKNRDNDTPNLRKKMETKEKARESTGEKKVSYDTHH